MVRHSIPVKVVDRHASVVAADRDKVALVVYIDVSAKEVGKQAFSEGDSIHIQEVVDRNNVEPEVEQNIREVEADIDISVVAVNNRLLLKVDNKQL